MVSKFQILRTSLNRNVRQNNHMEISVKSIIYKTKIPLKTFSLIYRYRRIIQKFWQSTFYYRIPFLTDSHNGNSSWYRYYVYVFTTRLRLWLFSTIYIWLLLTAGTSPRIRKILDNWRTITSNNYFECKYKWLFSLNSTRNHCAFPNSNFLRFREVLSESINWSLLIRQR